MPIDFFGFEDAHNFGDALPASLKLRHKIFIERQKYDVSTHNGMEYDSYDTPAARYLLWRDDGGHARGVMRVIPTNERYMIRELWPSLVSNNELPQTGTTWEISRFGIDADVTPEERQQATMHMVVALAELAERYSVKEFLFVTHPSFAKHVLRGVLNVEYLGEERKLGKFTVVAAKVSLPENVSTKLREIYGISGEVLPK